MDDVDPNSMMRFSAERQARVLALLKEQGRVEVLEVARLMQVSEHTVRRDLLALQKQGVLQRTHGGAIAIDTARADLSLRAGVATRAKAAMGRAAASLVQPGQTLMLDAGSTNLALARALVARPLTVITNSLDIAAVFAEEAGVQLALTGGSWRREARSMGGPAAEAMLQHCRADWAVPGACALGLEQGVTASDEADAALKRAMVGSAARTLVLGDRSKHGGVAPFLVAPWRQVSVLVSDQAWPELQARGVEVLLARD